MEKKDFKNFCQLLNFAALATNKDLKSKESIAFYFEVLSDLPFAQVAQAIKKIVQASKFFPTVAEIRETAAGRPEDGAARAWDVAIKAAASIGIGNSVRFEDPRTQYAIARMGGWRQLCNLKIDNQPFERKIFLQFWQEAHDRGITWNSPGVPPVFESLSDRNNRHLNYSHLIRPPVQVGALGQKTELSRKALSGPSAGRLDLSKVLKSMEAKHAKN